MTLCGRLGSIATLLSGVLVFAPGSVAELRSARSVEAGGVAVVQSGFKQVFHGHTGDSDSEYGVLLVNRSRSEDAFDVTLRISARSSSGGILFTDVQKITAIPAGTKFAVGGGFLTPGRARIASIRVAVAVKRIAPAIYASTTIPNRSSNCAACSPSGGNGKPNATFELIPLPWASSGMSPEAYCERL